MTRDGLKYAGNVHRLYTNSMYAICAFWYGGNLRTNPLQILRDKCPNIYIIPIIINLYYLTDYYPGKSGECSRNRQVSMKGSQVLESIHIELESSSSTYQFNYPAKLLKFFV